ncbi:hypothetical protein C1646_774587 [Rhizophagus diaphanus]|nr:hypothetical protein C1646_774587 [Rhizophagus diaphanus] [Rhizophagus sp. MUCL 43196]
MRTLVVLQNVQFIITVVKDYPNSLQQPGYICEAEDLISAIFNNPSAAVTTLYQRLFNNSTKFSGPLIMGHNKVEISEQLLEGVIFCPFGCFIGKFWLFVYEIGVSSDEQLYYAGSEFKSSFMYSIGKKKQRVLFVQEINTKNSIYEFWTRFSDPMCDREILHFLYVSGFLHPFSGQYCNDGDTFWKYFHKALEANKRGHDGKRRILSIIVENFSYSVLMEKLKVTRKYARANGPGCIILEKPIRKVKRITSEQQRQFDFFFQDKAHVIMSSYRTDAKIEKPVVYLKNTKNIFTYGYETFEDIMNLIKKKIIDIKLQNVFSQHGCFLRHYLKKEYEEHLVVTDHGFTSHSSYINHCLLYAFGECNESHTYICNKCQEIFQFFQDLKDSLNPSCHKEIQEFQDRILYYLAHQTRKTYLNAQFNAALLDLNEDEAILVVDYKMKILPKIAHSSEINIQAIDHWFTDAHQNAWFSASSLHSVIENLEIKPKWFEWTWPIEGENARYIKVRAIPNLGNWILFFPAQIQNFTKGEVNQPSPQVSESMNSKSP